MIAAKAEHAPSNSGLGGLKRLWHVLEPSEKRSLGWLPFFFVLASLAELGLLATVVPFVIALSSPTESLTVYGGSRGPVLQAGFLFLAAILLASAMRLVVLRMQVASTKRIAEHLSNRSYWRTLNRPYIDHVNGNTSHLIATMTGRLEVVLQTVVSSAIVGLSQLIISVSIIAALYFTSAWVTTIVLASVGGAYGVFLRRSHDVVRHESKNHNEAMSSVTRVLSESLWGVRDVLLAGNQAKWLDAHQDAQRSLRRANAKLAVTAATPRIVVEGIGFLVIAVVACILATVASSTAEPLSILAVVVLGSQRLLPVAQGLYASWNNLRSGLPHLFEVLPLLEQPEPRLQAAIEALPLRQRLEIRRLHYRYAESESTVLEDVDLVINAGSTVGIIGTTGCGKSTLLDLVMGLLVPGRGELIVDGRSLSQLDLPRWQRSISHVAQNIYLADATIAENIALGSPELDFDSQAIEEALRRAQLSDFVGTLPRGSDTQVGEKGVRLSGGQRQRLGIARALYRRSDLLILDEATNSLDEETELKVINGLGAGAEAKTILLVTHRLSTLAICDEIYRLENGRLEGPIPYGALGRGGSPDATRGRSSQERTQLATPE